MLYVFQVDTGSMTIFDMSVALESVANLKQVIAKTCKIPEDKQVLLISGGYSLDPSSRVCTYSAGTDTSPIFLFSKISIESESPPVHHSEEQISQLHSAYKDMKEKVEGCLNMPPTFNTIVTRAQLAQQFYELAQEQKCRFESLVHEQHLQQQGWAAVVANLEDITSVFKSRAESFKEKFQVYLDTREYNLDLLQNFSHDLQLLSKIPVLRALLKQSDDGGEAASSGLAESTNAVTLLQWISSKDNQNSLEQVSNTCLKGLEQFDSLMLESLESELESVLAAVNNPVMKEIKGLEEWLFGLEKMMEKARRIVEEQGGQAQALLQNQSNAGNQDDPSVLPNLCASHARQMQLMLENHQHLRNIQERFVLAKSEFSKNLHFRLRWIMYVEKMMSDVDSKLGIYHENLKRLKRHLEVVQQIHLAPRVYLETTVEVARRNSFSKAFLEWARSLSQVSSELHSQEVETRRAFNVQITNHFLQTLFPGMDDNPPPFATQPPAEFDTKLPPIKFEDVEALREMLPELSDVLSSPSSEPMPTVPPVPTSPERTVAPVDAVRRKEAAGDREIFSPITEEMELTEKKEATPLQKAVSEPGGSSGGCVDPDTPLSRARSEGDIKAPRVAAHDFLTPDFFIDESMPSSYTDSRGHATKSHHSITAELQRQLSEKHVQLTLAEEEVAANRLQMAGMQSKLVELQEWVQQLLKKDVVFVRDRLMQDRCQFGALADEIGETVRKLQFRFELEKQAAVARAVEEAEATSLQRLEIEAHKLADAERELDLYRQKLKEQSWLLDGLKRDSQQMQARYLEAEEELAKKMTLEHQVELRKVQDELECLKENLEDKIRELRLFWERNRELSCRVEELQGVLGAKEEEVQRVLKEREAEKRNHKGELEGMRCRFKLACSAMERSPSDGSLENIHLEKEGEGSGGSAEAEKWQKTLQEEHRQQMSALKLSAEKEKQMAVNEALLHLEETVAELRRTETRLMHQHTQDRETIERLLQSKVDASSEMKEALSVSMLREKEAREAHYHVESELLDSQQQLSEQIKKQMDLTVSLSSVMETSLLADKKVGDLKQKLMELSMAPNAQNIVPFDKVSVLSCNPGDVVLLTYDEQYDNYVLFILGSTLHFLHPECLETLDLPRHPTDVKTSWALAEVVAKEYCQARKAPNRYKVAMGKRFYRVTAKPWDREAAILREQQRRLIA